MLEVLNLTKRYGRRQRAAVRNLSLTLEQGEILGLVGLNGAGKTTTIRVIAGVALASAGDVRVEGKSITGEKAAASRHLGWVPEAPIHDSGARIGQLIRYYSRISESDDTYAQNIPSLLATWGIQIYENRPFRTLSLGERKRFALAVACLRDPDFYLLDEVFNGIDPSGVAQVRDWMIERRTVRKGILVSSHHLREVQAVAVRVAIIHEGRLLRCVSVAEIPSPRLRRLRIAFAPVDEGAVHVLGAFGDVEQTRDGVVLMGDSLDGSRVNRALLDAGYEVSRLEATDPDLETYFLQLVKELR